MQTEPNANRPLSLETDMAQAACMLGVAQQTAAEASAACLTAGTGGTANCHRWLTPFHFKRSCHAQELRYQIHSSPS